MYNIIQKVIVLISIAFSLSACNGFFEKDNTPAPHPLVRFKPEATPIQLWAISTGYGVDKEYLKEPPGIGQYAIFTANAKGTVIAINKANGRINWQINTRMPIMTGVGVGENRLVVAGRHGNILALDPQNGATIWCARVLGEVIAKPKMSHGIVVIKTVDGNVHGLSAEDGHEIWSYQQAEPNLILHGASAPLLFGHHIIVGFANGMLAKLSLYDGRVIWIKPIAIPEGAFAIQRMIDIDADPILFEQHIYAATYQGNIASLDSFSGKTLWSQQISSYTGMVADQETVFITDASSHIFAFNAESGLINWRQDQLAARIISAPALHGDFVVVGDGEGYVHWLSKCDGHVVARISLGAAIYATPLVENNVLYVLTSRGYLAAYILR